MATSNSPSQATVNQIAGLKTQQGAAITKANDVLQSQAYQDATNSLVPQAKARDEAQAIFANTLRDRSTTPAQIAEARANFEAADDRYRGTVRFLTAETAKASGALSEGAVYQGAINNTAGVQTTTPTPTLTQTTAVAEKTGQEVENANKNKNVIPPETLNPVPEPEPYDPAIETPVNRDDVYNALVQSFEDQRPPNSNTTTEIADRATPVALPTQQPPYVFDQSQLDYIESYNSALAESGNSALQVEANSVEALDVLIENGQISPDDDGFPEPQRTVTEEPGTGPGIAVNIRGVAFEEFQDESEFDEFQDEGLSLTASSDATEQFPFPVLTRPEQVVGSPAKDIRFRISLARSATYLYKSPNPGILSPLSKTDGVIFPYMPQVQVTYNASYNASDLTHSNYKIYNYKGSSVEGLQVNGDFTAQDSVEANYLLAVIHFFRSATKMFYGQDNSPARGVPPPLVYLSGLGQYQFDNHPALITGFTYILPTDVDYINAYPTNPTSSLGGFNLSQYVPQIAQYISPLDRLRALGGGGLLPGGSAPPPVFSRSNNVNEVTRVPTKISIQLSLIPVVTRNAISNKFSLQKYASGDLLRGSINPGTGGGIW